MTRGHLDNDIELLYEGQRVYQRDTPLYKQYIEECEYLIPAHENLDVMLSLRSMYNLRKPGDYAVKIRGNEFFGSYNYMGEIPLELNIYLRIEFLRLNR